MVSSIQNIASIIQKFTPIAASEKKSVLKNDTIPDLSDPVDVSPEGGLAAIQSQVSVLKQELPGAIATSLLESSNTRALDQQPLNDLLGGLTNPLESILKNTPPENLPEDLISGLRDDLKNLQQELPSLKSNALLAPLNKNAAQSNSLNSILTGISDILGGLIGQLRTGL
ncbi:MAG: hypothetical protein ACE5EK_11400 [Nitrospinales bacterium]